MINKFHVLYVGQIELDNIGLNGTPANDRRYSDERLREAFFTARDIAQTMRTLTSAQETGAGSGLVAATLKKPPKKNTNAAIPTIIAKNPINASKRMTCLRPLWNPDLS